jgi:hypothetical protein
LGYANRLLQNLGLGVLEEKKDGVEHDKSEEEDNDSTMNSDTEHSGSDGKEKDIIGSLMGQKKKLKPASIEEIEDD